MDDLEKRRTQAASSILENEGLTADLNDETADELLNWGLALAEKLVMDSQDLDDDAAEEAMYTPLKALRKMLRAINKWLNSGDATYLETILNQTPLIYGETAVIPPIESLTDIHTISALRQAIEATPNPSPGKDRDKKENISE